MESQENDKKKENKFSIHASTIFRNLIFILIICIAIYFTYSVISAKPLEESSEPPFTPVTESVSQPASETGTGSNGSGARPESSSQEENADVTSEESDSQSGSDGGYDAEFFSDTLFIGDSISTGISLYGFLDKDNVFAQQGLGSSTLFTAEIDGETCEDRIASTAPERIVIMLGTNELGYVTPEELAKNMNDCIIKLKSLFKGEIAVISLPPVTMEAEASDDNLLTLPAIQEYNSLLEKYAKDNEVAYIDLYSALVDDTGYFGADYAERDGIHFMGSAYQIMLSEVQSALSE